MASINNIAENIAFSIGEQFNETLLEAIRNSIVDYRALLIKQDLQRNSLSYTDYLQQINVEFELRDYEGRPLLVGKQKIPRPLRQNTNGRISYNFVGSKDRRTVYTFATMQEFEYMCHLPLQKNTFYYTVINDELLLLNNLKPCKLVVEEVVANPRDIQDCDSDLFPDDLPFNLPTDMIADIKKIIRREFQSPSKDGEEINIDKDDRN